MSAESSGIRETSKATELETQPLSPLQGQYLAALSERQAAARKDSEREPVCPVPDGKTGKLAGAIGSGLLGFMGEQPNSSPGSNSSKSGHSDASNESKTISSAAAGASFFYGGRSIFKPDSSVLRNGDGSVASINFKDGLVGSFEYFPDKNLRSVRLSDGRVYTRADAKAQWLDQNSAPADVTKIEVDGGRLRLTDKTSVTTHMSSSESVRKEFPNFQPDKLAGLYLKNESRLDLDKNGSIDRKELARGIVSNDFKGEDAQFVAALQLRYADLKGQRTGFLGWDDSGITLTDLQDFSAKAISEKALSDSAKNYEDVVTNKLLSEPGKSVTEEEVRAAVASTSDAAERDRLAQFLADFDKFTVSDWNPLAKKRVDLPSFQKGLKTLADAPAYAAAKTMEGWVNSGSDSLEKGTESVFGDERIGGGGGIRAAAVRQGSVGNCYFMAGLASLAEASPQTIKNMITSNADGTFTVRFPAIPDEPFVVSRPTEAERMLYSRSSQSGIWPQLIEKAYGAYRIKHGLVKPEARDRETGIAQEGSDGGDTIANGLSLLATGEVAVIEIAGKSEQEIGASISASLKAGKPVSLGLHKDEAETQKAGSPLEGLSNNHAYSVIGYDERSGKVLVRNPWGSGEPSKNGIARDCDNDGVFALTVGELKNYFYNMAFFMN
ncbi:MAG TPA: C2 family cysteine protease [Candidatus Obscuribacter sp.]|nr:C2 family cysteine protease [Candidatus Obscuribacter sp.]